MGGDPFVGADGGMGDPNHRYNSMEMKRLRDQEQAAGVPTQKLLRCCRIIDNNVLKHQNHLFQRWKSVTEDMKKGYLTKLRHFGTLLKIKGNGMLNRVFRRWEKNTLILRAQGQVDQVKAELRYEMCGMAYKIHELSSNNTLAASLAAERAINRELTDANLELRGSITELDTRLLECANAKPEERKMLVRDVLFGREDEVSFARRESKALRDELQTLYDLGLKQPEVVKDKVCQYVNT